MPEQMTKQSAIEALEIFRNDYTREGSAICRAIDIAIDALRQHTIEPEVRHGQMIEGRYQNDNKCSECGQEFRDEIGFIIQDDDGEFHYPKRCHECGCYWDGGC